MILLGLHYRVLDNKDWATLLFVLGLFLIVVSKTVFENRFNDFVRLFVSDKYLKIYKEKSHLISGFTIILFLVNLVAFSFLILLLFHVKYKIPKTDWVVFIQIFTFLFIFTLSKFLIEKIISVLFGLEELVDQINLQKVSYRTYVGMILFPFCVALFYMPTVSVNVIYAVTAAIIGVNLIIYFIFIKKYQNFIFSKIVYFILYLCALEIAPYYFIYYLITKK